MGSLAGMLAGMACGLSGGPQAQAMDNEGPLGGLGEAALVAAIPLAILASPTAPVTLPMLCTGDWQDTTGRFSRHPYAEDGVGYLVVAHDDGEYPPPPTAVAASRAWAGEVGAHGMGWKDGQALVLTARVSAPPRWSLEVDDSEFSGQDERTASMPHRLLGAAVEYRFAQAEWGAFRLGAGTVTAFAGQPATGPRITYDVDLFPARPLVVNAHADWGKVRAHAVVDLRASVGAAWRGGEIDAGYGLMRCQDRTVAGPLVGVRCWF